MMGHIESKSLYEKIKEIDKKNRVKIFKHGDRGKVLDIINHSNIGICLMKPKNGYQDALPTKMFEYMAAGIPVIASDFPLWLKILQGCDAGLVVDPFDPVKIARNIDSLFLDKREMKRLGQNGRQAALKSYNWESESIKLKGLYEKAKNKPTDQQRNATTEFSKLR